MTVKVKTLDKYSMHQELIKYLLAIIPSIRNLHTSLSISQEQFKNGLISIDLYSIIDIIDAIFKIYSLSLAELERKNYINLSLGENIVVEILRIPNMIFETEIVSLVPRDNSRDSFKISFTINESNLQQLIKNFNKLELLRNINKLKINLVRNLEKVNEVGEIMEIEGKIHDTPIKIKLFLNEFNINKGRLKIIEITLSRDSFTIGKLTAYLI